MSYRSRSKSEQQQQTSLRSIVFAAVAGGLVLIMPTSINFQLAFGQQGQEQQEQSSSALNDTTSSSPP
jgi:hypothetical protein